MGNLLHYLKEYSSPELLQAVSGRLNEPEALVAEALNVALPVYLLGVAGAYSHLHPKLTQILLQAGQLSQYQKSFVLPISNEADFSTFENIGKELQDVLFDNKATELSIQIANFAKINPLASQGILKIGAIFIASFLGRKMKSEKLSLNSILKWIDESKTEIAAEIPAGFLGDSGNLDFLSLKRNDFDKSKNMENGGKKWAFPLIMLVLLAIGIFWWMKGCNESAGDESENASEIIESAGSSIDSALNSAIPTIDSAIQGKGNGTIDSFGNWIAPKGDPIKIKLDNGVELDAFKGSIEDKMHSFIIDPGGKAGEDIWFDFNTVHFEKASSKLRPGYERQVANVCEIVKAYPQLKIKLCGFTDNLGDSLSNVKLSAARAKVVYDKMLANEVAKTNFAEKPFEGLGPQSPEHDNATPEGRARNRRIAIVILEK